MPKPPLPIWILVGRYLRSNVDTSFSMRTAQRKTLISIHLQHSHSHTGRGCGWLGNRIHSIVRQTCTRLRSTHRLRDIDRRTSSNTGLLSTVGPSEWSLRLAIQVPRVVARARMDAVVHAARVADTTDRHSNKGSRGLSTGRREHVSHRTRMTSQ